MAAIALMAVGVALAPFTGGASLLVTAGLTMVGGVIDSQFLFPAIFGRPQVMGSKLDTLKTQLATEGNPMNYCLGPENRVAGTVIWMTDLVQHKQSGGKGGKSGTGYSYTVSCAVGVCEGPISSIRKIWADNKLIYDADNGGKDKHSHSISIYPGNFTQTADPVIQAHEGAALVPAFRGTAYFVIENLQLTDFGNRLPQFNCQVAAQSTLTIGHGISLLLERAGLTSSQFDTTLLPGCIRGYMWSGPKSIQSAIIPMMTAYAIRAQEGNGVLRFFPKGNEDSVAVLEADLAAVDPSAGSLPDQVSISDVSSLTLPNEVNVNYLDCDNNYQQGSQSAHRVYGDSRASVAMDVPLVMRAIDAQAIAQRQLWTAWGERQAAVISLPPSYLAAIEGDVLEVPFKDNAYSVRIIEVNRGANFQLEMRGVIQDSDTVNVFGEADDVAPVFPTPVVLDARVVLAVMDLPALRIEDEGVPGMYLAASNLDPTDDWSGVTVFKASSASGSYSKVEVVPAEASIGTALTKLRPGTTTCWDYVNTLRVEIYTGELASASIDDVLGGDNLLLVGSEIIAFQSAELVDTGVYELSGLLRGRRNTEASMYQHRTGELVVLLDEVSLRREELNTRTMYATRYYKAVPTGLGVADVDPVPSQSTGANLLPFSPATIRARLNAGGDYVVTWCRRSRGVVNILGPVPNLDLDQYEVELAKNGAVFRTLACNDDTRTVTWTAAQQVTDAITGTITLKVFQKSKLMGRGRPGTILLAL